MKMSEFLYKSADHMAKVGHYKGKYFDRKGREAWEPYDESKAACCTVGSFIYTARMCETQYSPTDAEIVFRREMGLGENFYAVPEWNDAPERTAEEVILAIKTVAYNLEQNGD